MSDNAPTDDEKRYMLATGLLPPRLQSPPVASAPVQVFSNLSRLTAENAALRERLGKAEEREQVLRAGIRKATSMTHGHMGSVPYSEPSYNSKYMHKILNQAVADADFLRSGLDKQVGE